MKITQSRGLHAGNSRRYRPRPVLKHAVIQWRPAEYVLEWGRQTFDGPHVRVEDPGGPYGVELRTFFCTHSPVSDTPDGYVKTVEVRAVQVSEKTEIETEVRGRIEASSAIEPGGWILQGAEGELYYNTPDEFSRRYQLVEGE